METPRGHFQISEVFVSRYYRIYFKWKETDLRTKEQKKLNAKKAENIWVNVNVRCMKEECTMVLTIKVPVLRFLYYLETMKMF